MTSVSKKHWPHESSRCPECGIKQGDILPDIQPCRLSTRIEELEAARNEFHDALKLARDRIRMAALTVQDWPPDTVLGESGVGAMRDVNEAYLVLDNALLDYGSKEAEQP